MKITLYDVPIDWAIFAILKITFIQFFFYLRYKENPLQSYSSGFCFEINIRDCHFYLRIGNIIVNFVSE